MKGLTSRRAAIRSLAGAIAAPLIDSALRGQMPSVSAAQVAQEAQEASATPGRLLYVCPMDADVRSDKPGFCTRCGMRLRLGVPDLKEYRLELTTTPGIVRPGEKTQLHFSFKDPKTNLQVNKFEIVHEKLFHMFIVSSDLKYFLHDHPVLQPDGSFVFDQVFPKPGIYRLLADVFPSAGSPQLIPKTIFVSANPDDLTLPGDVKLEADLGVQHGGNTDASMNTIPATPAAGVKTLLFFNFNKADGMQKYLGTWAHMLIASDDTIDLIHEHPLIADGGTQMQFTLIFPRARTYRIWLQFMRSGVLNTVAFNLPVETMEQAEGIGVGF